MTGGGAAAAAAAAIANAVKASGAIIEVREEEFLFILGKTERPLIVFSTPSFWSRKHQYMTSYQGFVFYTKAKEMIQLPGRAEIIQAARIWTPNT
ncbi:MAG TPA: hypothetical protein PLW26_03825 [Candidatus Mcinerneyibacteriales bacterium]|nr:hypothetical protein [Candidatus Mcinerneyibacteriales bacterium]